MADALGRTRMTINKWISDGSIPPPCLTLHTGNRVMYSRDELQTIADVLRDHEKEFDFLLSNHSVTINRMWQRVEALRRSKGYIYSGDDHGN